MPGDSKRKTPLIFFSSEHRISLARRDVTILWVPGQVSKSSHSKLQRQVGQRSDAQGAITMLRYVLCLGTLQPQHWQRNWQRNWVPICPDRTRGPNSCPAETKTKWTAGRVEHAYLTSGFLQTRTEYYHTCNGVGHDADYSLRTNVGTGCSTPPGVNQDNNRRTASARISMVYFTR